MRIPGNALSFVSSRCYSLSLSFSLSIATKSGKFYRRQYVNRT